MAAANKGFFFASILEQQFIMDCREPHCEQRDGFW